ncbi:EAL and HDOD domain-containing protein [Vibrio breoganii]
MYSSYIARQSISDRSGNTVAYELLYRQSHLNRYPKVNANYATRSIMVDLLLDHSRLLLNNVTGYINFSHDCIINGLPLCLPPENIVVEVLEGDSPSAELIEAIKDLHAKGYQIALDDFIPSPEWDPVIPFISIIKIDIKQYSLFDSHLFIEANKHLNIRFIAEKIEHEHQYLQALNAGFDLFQGYYLSIPEMFEKHVLNESYPLWYRQVYQELNQKALSSKAFYELPNTIAANEALQNPQHQFISFSDKRSSISNK